MVEHRFVLPCTHGPVWEWFDEIFTVAEQGRHMSRPLVHQAPDTVRLGKENTAFSTSCSGQQSLTLWLDGNQGSICTFQVIYLMGQSHRGGQYMVIKGAKGVLR